MDFDNIIFQVDGGIATIIFNRPKALNALTTDSVREFSLALDEILGNEEIRVLILTGAGEQAFVAGADIVEISRYNAPQAKEFSKRAQNVLNKLQDLPIPVIAAVNGFALGGGSEFAVASDFIYASEDASFGLPEIKLGLIPGFGGTQRLPRVVGMNVAKEMIFTGNMISADEAKAIGLVNRVCPKETLMDEVIKTAKIIASRGKFSLRAAKQVVNNGMNVDLATACKIEQDVFALCFTNEDFKEGVAAFLEKRKANFKGSLKL